MFKSSLTFIFFWALLHLFCVCNQVPLARVVCMGWTLSHLCCTCTHQLQMCNELFKPLISALPFCIYIYIFNIQIYLYIKYEYTHTHTHIYLGLYNVSCSLSGPCQSQDLNPSISLQFSYPLIVLAFSINVDRYIFYSCYNYAL